MKRFPLILAIALASTIFGFTSAHRSSPRSAPQTKPADTGNLDAVLKKMDDAAVSFHTLQAEFEWDSYEKVIDEVDEIQTGTIYYRRNGKEIEMMAVVKMAGSDPKKLKPEMKSVLFSNGKISMYQPKPDQVTVYDLGKNRVDWETYVVLGFGGSGKDLVKAFDVTYVGPKMIDDVATAALELIPKSDKVRNNYNKIVLWIDLDKGISRQQQFFSPQGDYRLTKYRNIDLNGKKIPDDVFKLKTTSKTQTLSPKG
jgi:outer membrane lipoprotein-sorting protein